jgi:hypothetical protein
VKTINFTRAKTEELRTKYSEAVKNGLEMFLFEGHQLVTSYAKYLLEYLDTNFKPDVRELKESTYINRAKNNGE